jgi:integrase
MSAIPWTLFQAELIALYSPRRRAAKTRSKMRQVLGEVSDFVASTADLTPANVNRWVESRPDRLAMTFNGLISYLRTACRYAVARGYLDRSPFEATSFRLRVAKRPRRRHLSRDEIARLLAYLEARHLDSFRDGRLHALAMLLAHTGLRAMEALRLQVGDVDLDSGLLSVVARHRLKTEGSEATIPIPPAAIACLVAWKARCGPTWFFPGSRGRGPWVGGSNGKRPADFLDEAGIAAGLPPGTTLLMLRHSLSTHARTHFLLGSKQVQQILRHADERTQDHYIAQDLDNLREAVRRIDFRAPAH